MTERHRLEHSSSATNRFWILIVILFLALCFPNACKKDTTETTDVGEVDINNNNEDSQASEINKPDSNDEPSAGIFYEDSKAYAVAVGKAPRGRDVSLARDHAAASARANLLALLKEKGYAFDPPDTLQGATIERYWNKGRFTYAESVVPLAVLSPALNESSAPPSKKAEGKQP
jgi:hypothetical protein